MILAPSAASTRLHVPLFRALMGAGGAAVSRRAVGRFETVIYAGSWLPLLCAACLWCSCLCPDVGGRVAAGRETVTHFVLFKRCESRELVNREKVTEEPQTACRLVYLKRPSWHVCSCQLKAGEEAACQTPSWIGGGRWCLKWKICPRCRLI